MPAAVKMLAAMIAVGIISPAAFLITRALQTSQGDAAHTGRLDVMLDGHDLFVDFDAPALGVLGFESAPANWAEHDTLLSTQRLLDSASLIEPAAAAQCVLTESYVSVGHGYNDLCATGKGVLPENATPTTLRNDRSFVPVTPLAIQPAAEVAARWSWHCRRPKHLDTLQAFLLRAFPGMDDMTVQLDIFGSETTRHITREQAVARTSLMLADKRTSL